MDRAFVSGLLEEFEALRASGRDPIGIIVMRILTKVIEKSDHVTLAGLNQDLAQVLHEISNSYRDLPLHFSGSAKLFLDLMERACLATEEDWKTVFTGRAHRCLEESNAILSLIPAFAAEFIQHGMTILTRGYDPMVRRVIEHVASKGGRFSLVITEGRPLNDGFKFAETLKCQNVDTTLIPDAAVGLWMGRVQTVLLGADIVLEDGGVLAPVGTYNMCVLASIHHTPVYCVCETYKFTRDLILAPQDLDRFQRTVPYVPPGDVEDGVEPAQVREFDYTPAKFVTLLITEKGPMPSSAVTHELRQLLSVR
jgi:translation initiation factor eIF-2B subunit alpha